MTEVNLGYCALCSCSFLNAASLIRAVWGDRNNRQYEDFRERGNYAIVAYEKWVAEMTEEHPGVVFRINDQELILGIRAVALVDGTGVCPIHLWDAIEQWRNPVRQRYYR